MGRVTVRQAADEFVERCHGESAEMVGYGRVVQIAARWAEREYPPGRQPLQLGAIRIDAAGSRRRVAPRLPRWERGAEPYYIKSVVSAGGNPLEKYAPTTKLARYDPRVTYLVDSIPEGRSQQRHRRAVRAKGFTLPAAGKTGTSRDGWFAGFTSNLVCVIWIGFDDNHDLGLAGGATGCSHLADSS